MVRRLGRKQAREHRGELTSLLLLTFLLCGLISFTLGNQRSAVVSGTQAVLGARDGAPVAAYLQTTLSPNPGPQADAAHRLFQRLFVGAPLIVDRTLRTKPQAVVPAGTAEPSDGTDLVLADAESLRSRAVVVSGSWPPETGSASGQPIPAALQADTARQLGVRVGDELVIGNDEPRTTVTITATWRATDRTDPFWVGDPTVTGGGPSADADGLLLISEASFADLTTRPLVRWVIRPDTNRTRPTQATTEQRALDRLEAAAEADDDVSVGGASLEPGGFGVALDRIDRSVVASRGVTPLPVIMISTVGLLAVGLVAQLLATGRSSETALLRSRGASPGQLLRMSLAEAAMVGIVGAAAGLAVAALALLSGGSDLDVALGAWSVAPATAAATCLLMVGTQFADARRGAGRPTNGSNSRRNRTVSFGVAGLSLGAAGLSVSQFRLYGSPLVDDAAGRPEVDPLAVLAPALSLVALCLVSLVALQAFLVAVQPAVARLRAFGAGLVVRHLSRRATALSVPFLAVCASVALTVVSASYDATWLRLTTTSAQLGNAADIRVTVPTTTSAPSLRTTAFVGLTGVRKAAPVLSTPVNIGDQPLTLTALAAQDVRPVMTDAGGGIDTAAFATAMAVRPTGPLLPDTTDAVDLSVAYIVDGSAPPASARRPDVTLWLADDDGILTSIPLTAAPQSGTPDASVLVLTGAVPSASERWRLVAIDLSLDGGGASSSYGVQVTSVSARTAAGGAADVRLGAGWTGETRPFGGSETAISRTGVVGFDLALSQPDRPQTVRLLPPAAGPLPLVIDRATAARLGFKVGDPMLVTFTGSGLSVSGRVALVTGVVPGGAPAARLLVDLPALTDAVLRQTTAMPSANEIWIAADPGTAGLVRAAAGPGTTVTTSSNGSGSPILGGTARAMWTGAIGATLLALLAVAATSALAGRTRRGEVIVLRAVGASPLQQARGRAHELLSVVLAATVCGLGVGITVTVMTVAPLARSAVIDLTATLPAPLEWAAGPASLLGAGFVAAALLVAAWTGFVVRGQARQTGWREEVR